VTGTGHVGRWQPNDRIALIQTTQYDIDRINDPRTSASADRPLVLVPGKIAANFPATLRAQEQFMSWGESSAQICTDKMIHIVTYDGARPNHG
jgi:hypothetical protein